jgi:UDP-glucose 4-epimerase
MKIFVTGGAGYIGAHIVKCFMDAGHDVVAFDDLSNSDLKRINYLGVDFVEGSVTDGAKLRTAMSACDLVIHCAGLKSVEESERNPEKYHFVNYVGTQVLLEEMSNANIKNLVFASTAAVYGNSVESPITESSNPVPISVYGKTKLDAEALISDYVNQGKVNAISLRFFNAVGAIVSELGDSSRDNLFPKVFASIDRNIQPEIFGDDYPTPDGTCIRDYIHVQDIAEAHLVMSEFIKELDHHVIFNLGTGHGYSVKEIIAGIEKQSGIQLVPVVKSRRAGDLAVAYADVSKVKEITGWKARFNLEEMIDSAWKAWGGRK